MLLPRQFISFVVVLGAVYLSGCHTTQAHSAPATSPARKTQTASATPPISKHLAHDSALSTYNNPAYGLSFRYPRNYLLDDPSDSESDSIIEAQQNLAAQQPGAVLVAIVTIPPDAYPNTTFVSGSLQLIVNRTVSPEVCRSFVAPPDDAYASGVTPTQSFVFQWRQRSSGTLGTGYLNRAYATFSNNACYELFLEIVTGSNPDLDPCIKPTNEIKIFHHLDKIVSSFQIHPHS
jgi:hypothetical protein